jgi:sugar phosphate permease
MPVMPYAKGTTEYALGIAACGAILTLSSFYVVRGETRLNSRSLLSIKLIVASLITLIFGLLMLVGSIVYLIRV